MIRKMEIEDRNEFIESVARIPLQNIISMEVETYTGSHLDGVNWDFLKYVYDKDRNSSRSGWIDYTIVYKDSVSPDSLVSDFDELRSAGLRSSAIIIYYEG